MSCRGRERNCVVQFLPQELVSKRIGERIGDEPVPQNLEQIVEPVSLTSATADSRANRGLASSVFSLLICISFPFYLSSSLSLFFSSLCFCVVLCSALWLCVLLWFFLKTADETHVYVPPFFLLRFFPFFCVWCVLGGRRETVCTFKSHRLYIRNVSVCAGTTPT